MSRYKPRIVITVVTDSSIEFSTVKGRDMGDGQGASAGPSKKQFEIVRKAIRDLVSAP